MKCWPQPGWGHRPTRKGKAAWEGEEKIYPHHIKGACFYCAGTGLKPIPMEEVMKRANWMWDDEDAQAWLGNE
jgi:hypothetical protein